MLNSIDAQRLPIPAHVYAEPAEGTFNKQGEAIEKGPTIPDQECEGENTGPAIGRGAAFKGEILKDESVEVVESSLAINLTVKRLMTEIGSKETRLP